MSIPYIPLYVADYEADTAHLSLEEDGAYLRLLRLCWRTPGCSVPSDPRWIMRKMRVSADDYYRVVEPLIDEFFTRGMDRVFSARLQAENERINDTHKKRSDAGKRGNEKKRALKTNDKVSRPAHATRTITKTITKKKDLKKDAREILLSIFSAEATDDYLEHRKAKRAKITPRAAELIVAKFTDTPTASPDECIYQSIAMGWTGVFNKGNEKGKETESGAATAKRVAERWTSRRMDNRSGADTSQPLLSTGQPD